MYDALLKTLHKINTKNSWYSLQPYEEHHHSIIIGGLDFTEPLSVMLQATSMDFIKAYRSINLVQSQWKTLWAECDKEFAKSVWKRANKILIQSSHYQESAGEWPTEVTFLMKVHKSTIKFNFFISIIDHLVAELHLRFSEIQVSAVCWMYLIPKNIVEMTDEHRDNISKFFEWALPSPQTFNQELGVWRKMLQKASVGVPSNLECSLEACNQKLFPNIYKCLHLLMIIPLSTATTECSHSFLQVMKTKLQSTMGQNRLNTLMLLYIHKDIPLNYNKIIDLYVNR